MSKPVKVYNKGIRPVVFKRDRKVIGAIHPAKFLMFDPENAKAIIKKHEDACSESDYKKHLEELEKAREKERKIAEAVAKKKAKAKKDEEDKETGQDENTGNEA